MCIILQQKVYCEKKKGEPERECERDAETSENQ